MGAPQSLGNYIGGSWVSSTGPTVVVRNPATDRAIATYGETTSAEAGGAVEAAEAAFWGWRSTPPLDRARLLMKFRALLFERRDTIAEALSLEHGKTLQEARLELERGIENIEVACGAPTLLQGDVLEDAARGIDEYAIRQPLGVCASLNPFNFPGMIPLWSLPYALVCGNCMVVKASPRVPTTLVKMFEALDECGFPAGVANLLLGGEETANVLVEHPSVKAISFVGSTRVGRDVYERAARHGKRVQVGAGAKNFCVVLPDAHIEKTVENLVASAMGCSGQRCLALAGAIVVGGAHRDFRAPLMDAVRSLRVGFALDPDAQMGPVISREAQHRIEGWIARGEQEGARVSLDGRGQRVEGYPDGYWVGPTLLEGCEPAMDVAQEEIFGPVLAVLEADTLDDAIEMINASPYGNAAAIYTASGKAARKFRYEVQAGNIGVNVGVAAPMAYFHFGGWKDSFFGMLHAQGKDAFQFFTDAKICIERWH